MLLPAIIYWEANILDVECLFNAIPHNAIMIFFYLKKSPLWEKELGLGISYMLNLPVIINYVPKKMRFIIKYSDFKKGLKNKNSNQNN